MLNYSIEIVNYALVNDVSIGENDVYADEITIYSRVNDVSIVVIANYAFGIVNYADEMLDFIRVIANYADEMLFNLRFNKKFCPRKCAKGREIKRIIKIFRFF